MNDMSDFKVFEAFQNVATNKLILNMFAMGDIQQKELDTANKLLNTCNRHGVSTLTVMNIFADLFEQGVFHAE